MKKTYIFAVHNWKSDCPISFWVRKAFPSAYAADRWATRNTFEKKNSPYTIVPIWGAEE